MARAYLILAHKHAPQVARLFDAVHRPDDTIVLHFDRRADASLHRLGRELASRHPNVIVLRPKTIVWGGFTAAAVQLEAMAAALRADDRWHHFINLSGQDFPIKRLEHLEAHLLANPDANYVPWFEPLATSLWANARKRIEYYYIEWAWLDRVLRLRGIGWRLRRLLGWQNQLPHVPLLRRRPPEFRYYGGSNYVTLSRASCEYIVFHPEARRIARWLRHSAHPDEMLVQSVLLNSPLAATVLNTSLHAIEFAQNSPHPRTYTVDDVDRLLRSPFFFARKFDSSREPQILEHLARQLELSHS